MKIASERVTHLPHCQNRYWSTLNIRSVKLLLLTFVKSIDERSNTLIYRI